MKKVLSFTILLLFGIYTLFLYSQNKLGLYIHPRFFEESFAAGLVAVFVGILGISISLKQRNLARMNFIDRKFLLIILMILFAVFINPLFCLFALIILFAPIKDKRFDDFLKNEIISTLIVGSIALIGLLLPARGLSSITASQRSIDLNSINLTENNSASAQSFNKSTSKYSIGDWIASLAYNPDNEFYKAKEVNLTGFVYHPENQNLNEDTFLISRFIITCCAVDARPVGLKVKYSTWKDEFKQDEWVSVSGKFDINNDELVIIPDKITQTDQPANPYIY